MLARVIVFLTVLSLCLIAGIIAGQSFGDQAALPVISAGLLIAAAVHAIRWRFGYSRKLSTQG